MQIVRSDAAQGLHLNLKGRLDEYWARYLASTLEKLLREGEREVRLNLAEVTYLGSAGVGVLVKYQQELLKAGGTLNISVASTPVKRVLEMAKLGELIVSETVGAAQRLSSLWHQPIHPWRSKLRSWERATGYRP